MRRQPSPHELAAELQELANEDWEARLGPHTATSGFQVHALPKGLFASVLYAGRHVVGTFEEVRAAALNYVDVRLARRSHR